MRTVLIVDDHPLTRSLWAELLAVAGETARGGPVQSAEVGTLREAKDWLKANPSPYGVLLDLGLPDSHGLDALTTLGDLYPSLPVIVITGRSDPDIAKRALEAGAQDFVVKGSKMGPELILRTIEHAVYRSQALEDLYRSQAELTAFASSVAHELTSPIAAMSTMLTILDRDHAVDAGHAEMLELARDSATELAAMAHAMAAGGFGFEHHRPIDMRHAADWALTLLEPEIRSTKTTVHIEDDLPIIMANRQAVHRVMLTLLANAIRYRDPNRDPHVVIYSGPQQGPLAHIVIQDNGSGLAPTAFKKAFDAGASVIPSSSGLGKGLATVRKLVLAHGGSAWIEESPTGNGIEVHTLWPRADDPCDLNASTADSAPAGTELHEIVAAKKAQSTQSPQ